MGLLREINLAGRSSQVQNFVQGDNISFTQQGDGTIRISADRDAGCVVYTFGWDSGLNAFVLRNSDNAVVQQEPLDLKVLRVEDGNSYFEVDTVNGTVSMSADIKAAFNAALA